MNARIVAAVVLACVLTASSREYTPSVMAFLTAFYRERSALPEDGLRVNLFFADRRQNEGRTCNDVMFSQHVPALSSQQNTTPFRAELRLMTEDSRTPHQWASDSTYVIHVCAKSRKRCSLLGRKVITAIKPRGVFISIPLRLQRQDLTKPILLRIRIRERYAAGKSKLLPCSSWPFHFENFKPVSMLLVYSPQTNFRLSFMNH